MTSTSMQSQPPTEVLGIEEPSVKFPWGVAGVGAGVGILIVLLILGFAAYAYIWNLVSILVICTLVGICAAQFLYNTKIRDHSREEVARAHQRMDDILAKYNQSAPTQLLAPVQPVSLTDLAQAHRMVVLETVLAALKGGKTAFSQAQREQLERIAHVLLDPARTEFKFTQQRAETTPPADFQTQLMRNWTPVLQVVNTWASDPHTEWTDRKSTRLNSSHSRASRMPSSA